MNNRMLESVRGPFRAIATTIVPECSQLDEDGWLDVERRIEDMLSRRDASVRGQLVALIRVIQALPLFRYGRTFSRLSSWKGHRILAGLQNSRLSKLRTGFWGLRTLVFLGYYGRDEVRREIGYAAQPEGWDAFGS
jgi:hypothetical protein